VPSLRPLLAVLILPAVVLVCAAPSASAAPVHDPFERQVVTKINGLRAEQGLQPLRSSRTLARAASRHSRDQLRYDRLSHDSGSGTPFRVRMARLARKAIVGETVGWLPDGMSDRADRLVMMWMRSPSHRAQLMRPRFRKIGVGRWYGAMGVTPGIAVTANFSSR
jgi:uncharacterized protein YkwD